MNVIAKISWQIILFTGFFCTEFIDAVHCRRYFLSFYLGRRTLRKCNGRNRQTCKNYFICRYFNFAVLTLFLVFLLISSLTAFKEILPELIKIVNRRENIFVNAGKVFAVFCAVHMSACMYVYFEMHLHLKNRWEIIKFKRNADEIAVPYLKIPSWSEDFVGQKSWTQLVGFFAKYFCCRFTKNFGIVYNGNFEEGCATFIFQKNIFVVFDYDTGNYSECVMKKFFLRNFLRKVS